MKKKIVFLFFIVFALASCSHFFSKRSKKVSSSPKIEADTAGSRWVDVTTKNCSARVLSFEPGHFRLALIEQKNTNLTCETGTSPLIEAFAPGVKALLKKLSPTPIHTVQVELSLNTNPTLLKKWSVFLKQSVKWQNRNKTQTTNANLEQPLILTLLEESSVFTSYEPLFSVFKNYPKRKLRIEKIIYTSAYDLPFYISDLKNIGYFPQEQIPIPQIIEMNFYK